MITYLYNIGICLMTFGIRVAALFDTKARLWVHGRRNIFRELKESIDPEDDIIWFHAASLGEFEQGRPVMEAVRNRNPRYKILLTFFSPSGYELRKNYNGVDYVFYLPADTSWNARRFIRMTRPKIVFFIKYEFWANYLRFLRKEKIRTYIISAVFRPDSPFFNKVYGKLYRRVLSGFEWIFVQDERSRKLLNQIGIDKVTVTGDTRFDRVCSIAKEQKTISLIDSFKNGHPVIIGGSTWGNEEEMLLRLIDELPDTKFIIAPHQISSDHIDSVIATIKRPAGRFTDYKTNEDISGLDVLFIDTIGILSAVYRYGEFALIGGGFGSGLHNILEPAVYGLPVAFGPDYRKFHEAEELILLGGAKSIANYYELHQWLNHLREDERKYMMASKACFDYIHTGVGATERILSRVDL